MNHPTSRLACSQAGSGLPTDILDAFAADLHAAGYSADHVRLVLRGARHFLLWLDLGGIAVGSVDDAVLRAFRRHDCQCPGMERERPKMLASDGRAFLMGALKLIQLLEDRGDVAHPGELEANLRHLDDFITHCGEQGYRPGGICNYRSSCRHFLIWLHRSRIPITDVDAATLERFRQHDCVCPDMHQNTRRHGTRPVSRIRSFVHHLNTTGVVFVQFARRSSDRPMEGSVRPVNETSALFVTC